MLRVMVYRLEAGFGLRIYLNPLGLRFVIGLVRNRSAQKVFNTAPLS